MMWERKKEGGKFGIFLIPVCVFPVYQTPPQPPLCWWLEKKHVLSLWVYVGHRTAERRKQQLVINVVSWWRRAVNYGRAATAGRKAWGEETAITGASSCYYKLEGGLIRSVSVYSWGGGSSYRTTGTTAKSEAWAEGGRCFGLAGMLWSRRGRGGRWWTSCVGLTNLGVQLLSYQSYPGDSAAQVGGQGRNMSTNFTQKTQTWTFCFLFSPTWRDTTFFFLPHHNL